jgi:hypothetical protein
MEYYSSLKKKELLPPMTTHMNPESIMPCEITGTERQKLYGLTYMWSVSNLSS